MAAALAARDDWEKRVINSEAQRGRVGEKGSAV